MLQNLSFSWRQMPHWEQTQLTFRLLVYMKSTFVHNVTSYSQRSKASKWKKYLTQLFWCTKIVDLYQPIITPPCVSILNAETPFSSQFISQNIYCNWPHILPKMNLQSQFLSAKEDSLVFFPNLNIVDLPAQHPPNFPLKSSQLDVKKNKHLLFLQFPQD